ncbi:MAG: helix-turn-helix transcriptional regulator [Clostridia bacterium]|nr:helix-turn-helix transcriptional regulator [Clostridia bacterium]
MNGNMLRGLIIAAGYTLQEFAQAMGINNTSLSHKINSKRDFTLKEVQKISRILRLTDDQIYTIFFA